MWNQFGYEVLNLTRRSIVGHQPDADSRKVFDYHTFRIKVIGRIYPRYFYLVGYYIPTFYGVTIGIHYYTDCHIIFCFNSVSYITYQVIDTSIILNLNLWY